MKYLITFVVGLAVGGAIALAGLYFNPLSSDQGTEPGVDDWSLHYAMPSDDMLLLTHGGRLRLPVTPAGAPDLWESTLRGTFLQAAVMRDADDREVVATRISVSHGRGNLIRHGLPVRDRWLITVPGEGSLSVDADSNFWPLVRDHLLPVWYLRRDWSGPQTLHTVVGPGLRNTAVVDGLTGRFAAMSGSAVEHLELQQVSPNARSARYQGALHVRLVADASDAPDAPEPPDTADTSDTLDTSDTPDTPDTPESSDADATSD